ARSDSCKNTLTRSGKSLPAGNSACPSRRASFQGPCTYAKRRRAFNDEHCGAVVLVLRSKHNKKNFARFVRCPPRSRLSLFSLPREWDFLGLMNSYFFAAASFAHSQNFSAAGLSGPFSATMPTEI